MITLAIAFGLGLAVGSSTVWFVASHRVDQDDIALMKLRRHNADLRHSNAKLSAHCGHCGTSRAYPVGGEQR